MNKNIQFHIMSFCNSLVFFAPVAILLRTTKGVTLSQFFLLQALLSIVIFLLEIPTGILADKIGYKKAIFFSQIILFLARFLFLIADHIIYFVIEAILEAFSCCFLSGTTDAYLYERCKQTGDAGKFVTELATLVSIVAVLTMPEILRKTNESVGKPDSSKQTHKILKILDVLNISQFTNILWGLIILDTILGVIGLIINFLYVEILNWSEISVEWITQIILGYSILELFVPKALSVLQKRNEVYVYREFSMLGAGLLLGIFLFQNHFSIVFMIVLPFVLGIVENIQYKYENTYIDELGQSQNRATLLSVINMGNNLFSVIFLLFSAIVTSEQGNVIFLFAGIMMVVVSVIGSRIIRQCKDKI